MYATIPTSPSNLVLVLLQFSTVICFLGSIFFIDALLYIVVSIFRVNVVVDQLENDKVWLTRREKANKTNCLCDLKWE